MPDIDTSTEGIDLHIQRCWLTDPAPERTEALLRALLAERTALRAENERLRKALKYIEEHAKDYSPLTGNSIDTHITEYARAALKKEGE